MGPAQLAGVMETITRGAAVSSGKTIVEEELKKTVDAFRQHVVRDSDAFHTSAHLLDDGIIDPRDTRDVLGMCLEVVSLHPIVGNEGFRGLARM